MNNFDFHNLLFPTEFENFCRDLLEIREPDIKFTTYRRGRDGGIDIKSTNTEPKIIGQCKLYHPQNYKGLINNLKKEVTKCKKQQPDRYIVCTNIELSPTQAAEIKALFDSFILYEEDIIDGIKLNKYLGQKEYEYLFKTYSKLLVPNFSSIELALEKIINKKYYNRTKTFFDDICERHKLFHNTEQLPYLIQKLEDNKVIILSGNPGVGKTTTAMMIANYFFNRKKCDVIYLEERDYPETLTLANENRLVIVDDFWGQNFSPSIQNYSTFQREFQSIIRHFTNSSNSYLILVSREYVIKDTLANAEYETETLLDKNKYIINIAEFTFEDKLRIFLNHLLFYDYDLSYIKRIKYEDGFEYLLNHQNYSPRHLDFFIKAYLREKHQSSYDFYRSFRSYLDNPLIFWKEAYGKLNPTSKLILIILLTSSDPIGLEDLKRTFDIVQAEARQTLNIEIAPLDFRKELIKLEEFYIAINEDSYYDTTLIQFQSPGIKDYLLEFLRTDGYLWIKPIISNALFFNQLTFVFSTDDDEKISDYESDIYLHGQKIRLDDNLRKVLKQKLISEFEDLQFSNYEEREFSDQLTRFHSHEDTKYLKLIDINGLFDADLPENNDVRKFIIRQVRTDIDEYQYGRKVVSHRSMMYFPYVIKSIFPYLNINADRIIQVYYDSITFASEYDYFYKFSEIFPSEFQHFYNSNIRQIRRHIKRLLFEDIDYYLDEDDGKIGIELDTLMNVTIEELAKNYKIRITKKFVNDLESAFDINFSFLLKEKKATKSKRQKSTQEKVRNKYEPKSYEAIVDEYLPSEEDTYNPISFLKEYKYHQYIKEVKNDHSILLEFKSDKLLFEDVCHFLVRNGIQIETMDTYHLIDVYFENHSKEIGVRSELLASFYYQVFNELEQSDSYSITKSKLKNLLITKSTLTKLTIDDLSPIIVPYKSWYKFSTNVLGKYFLARHIYAITDDYLFKEQIIDAHALFDPYDNQILEFLESIDKERLWNFYIIPEFSRLIEYINFTNEKTIALSFINFFAIEFDLCWNQKEKTFDTFSSSCGESHFENILSFCNIEFYTSDFEIYFEAEYQGESTVNRLNINTKVVKKLNQKVLKTVQQKNGRYFGTHEPVTLFEVKLFDFLQSENNYQIAHEIGMITYIGQVIEKIKTCANR